MKRTVWAGLAAALGLLVSATTSQTHELGSNLKPFAFGDDQTIVDLNKIVWSPLEVEGLPKGAEVAVLRGDFAKDGVEAILRIPPGYYVPNHTHTSDEVYLFISGAFTLIAHDGKRTDFAGPAYVSFPGNAPPHAVECGKSEPCIFYLKFSRPFDIKYSPEVKQSN
ncbi:MAG: cupin domain-containing protein [Filomicrobium sp.]